MNFSSRKFSSGVNIKSAKILRAKPVIDLYGAGLPQERVKDDAQRQAIETRKPVAIFGKDEQGAQFLRVITPYLASKNFHGTDCTVAIRPRKARFSAHRMW